MADVEIVNVPAEPVPVERTEAVERDGLTGTTTHTVHEQQVAPPPAPEPTQVNINVNPGGTSVTINTP